MSGETFSLAGGWLRGECGKGGMGCMRLVQDALRRLKAFIGPISPQTYGNTSKARPITSLFPTLRSCLSTSFPQQAASGIYFNFTLLSKKDGVGGTWKKELSSQKNR